MSNGIRTRFRRWISERSSKEQSSSSAGLKPGPIAGTSLPTDDGSQDFLGDVLKALPEHEKSVVQKYAAPDIDINSTIRAAYDAAKERKAVYEKNRWPGSDKADKVLLWLDRFKSAGDVVANVDPIHIGLPWAGIRILLEIAVADVHQMTALFNGMDLALCLANRLQAYFTYFQRLPPAPTTDNLRNLLIKMHVHILRFLISAIRALAMNSATRKVWALWKSSDLDDFQNRCDGLGREAEIEANTCDRCLREMQWAEATRWKDDLDTKLDDIQRIRSSLDALREKVDLFKLITVPEATYNSIEEERLPRCLDGTRLQILQDISQWAEDPDSKPMFWLCGQAGTGKSTISRTVAQSFREQKRLAASFFFKREEAKRSNANHFFSTVAAQIADIIPSLRAPIAAALDKDSFLSSSGIQEQFEKLLLHPTLGIDSGYLPRKRVVIVIDALDECDQHTDLRKVLKLLAQLEAQSALRLRIFLTSRPEPAIRLGFQALGQALYRDVVLEKAQKIRDDIRLYFEDEFAKIRQDRLGDALSQDWPGESVLRTLVDLADPLFIFASTVCRFVSEKKPRIRLELILAQRYAALPSSMAKTYLPVLNYLLLNEDEAEQEKTIEDFQKIVGPIILAANPLSVASLASLLRIPPDRIEEEIRDLLERLHSVLDIPPTIDAPIKLLHLSFRDFLIDRKQHNGKGFWIDEGETHKKLASYCLERLDGQGGLKMDICYVKWPGTRYAELSKQRIGTYIPPDVAYACSYWPLHVIKSKIRICDNGKVHRFMQGRLLHWLEALSWLGRLSSAVAYIEDLLSIAQGDGCSEVAAFLHECKRFILYNRYAIDQTPLQIYHSAIVFTPLQSVLRSTFCTQAPQLWAPLPSAPLRWSAEVLALEGHDDFIRAVEFSPDGRVIASGSLDNTVRLWDAATGEQMQKLEYKAESRCTIQAVAFSPDGRIVASASSDRILSTWNVATGEQIWNSEQLFPEKMWKLKRGRGLNKNDGFVASSPDGRVIASTSWDYKVRLRNAVTGEQIQELGGDSVWFPAAAFSPDGRIVASSDRMTVRLWNVAAGEQTQKVEQTKNFEGHSKKVTAIACSPDGQIVASASFDETVRLWNVETGEQLQKLEHEGCTGSIAFSPDGRVIASGDGSCAVLLWNVATGEEIQTLEGTIESFGVIVFSPDGQIIASPSHDHIVRLWNAATGEQMQKFEGHSNYVTAIVFSPDGQKIASGSSDTTVRLWDAATGEQMQKFEGHSNRINAIAFSPDGQMVTSASSDHTVRLWNAATGEQVQKFEEHSSRVEAVAFSPDGQKIASGSWDATVRLWNAATGEAVQLIHTLSGANGDIAFSPDGKFLKARSQTFCLEHPVPGSCIDACSRTSSLELWEPWVCNQGKEFLWLPLEYRGSVSAIQGQTLVIGQDSGAVTFLRPVRDVVSSDPLSTLNA